MMRCVWLAALCAPVVHGVQIPNGGFETVAGETPAQWRLSGGNAGSWLPNGGRTGAGVRVAGNGTIDSRWFSDPVGLEPGRDYAFSFWMRGNGSGCVVSGTDEDNVDWGFSGTNWTRRLFVFRAPNRPAGFRTPLHLGQWMMSGEVVFDDVAIEPLKAVYAQADGLELGQGEQVEERKYVFSPQLGGVTRNASRPLLAHTASFNTDRWCVNGGTHVTYRHALPDRTWTTAKLSLACGYYAHGRADVEVSRDGKDWTRLASFTNSTTVDASVPAALLPSREFFVRVRGESSCNLQINSYTFEATFDGAPAHGIGSTRYVSEETGKVVCKTPTPEFYRTDYGERLPGAGCCTLWRASSGWKISRRRVLPMAQAKGLSVKTAANEAEAVQLVVTPRTDLRNVRVSAGALRAANGREIPAPEVLRVGYVPVAQPTDGVGCRGLWPDPLPPQEGALTVAANQNQPFWIRVKPPKGTPAVVYTGSVAVCAEPADGARAETFTVPLEVEVFGFELPDEMTCETSFGFNPWTVSRYHGLKTDDQRRQVAAKYLRSLADHHISPYNPTPFVPWTVKWKESKGDPSVAEPIFDWAAWDAAMEEAFAKYHFNTFVIGVQGLGGGTYESRVEPTIMGIPASNPAYDVLMGKYLKKIEAHLREKGWLDKAYVYWFDEPEPKDYAFVMNGFRTLKKHAPGLRRMLTEEALEPLHGGPNIWVPLTPNLHVPGEAKARAAGDTFWWYVCCGPKAPYVTEFTDHPGTELRLWLWQTWGENVTGILIWETVWWTSSNAYPDPARPQNPYEDAMCWCQGASLASGAKSPWGNGDGRFLYPPAQAAQPSATPIVDAGPVDSLRLEMLRDGIEDYEYFALLKRLLASAKDLPAATRAEYEKLLKVPSDVYTSLTEFATDPASMEAHRVKLARAIAELSSRARRP